MAHGRIASVNVLEFDFDYVAPSFEAESNSGQPEFSLI